MYLFHNIRKKGIKELMTVKTVKTKVILWRLIGNSEIKRAILGVL
jgi:acyl CoA:acetate/3-ketoacid CoA transferase alpha subunit